MSDDRVQILTEVVCRDLSDMVPSELREYIRNLEAQNVELRARCERLEKEIDCSIRAYRHLLKAITWLEENGYSPGVWADNQRNVIHPRITGHRVALQEVGGE